MGALGQMWTTGCLEKFEKVHIFASANRKTMVCRESEFLYSANVNLDTSQRYKVGIRTLSTWIVFVTLRHTPSGVLMRPYLLCTIKGSPSPTFEMGKRIGSTFFVVINVHNAVEPATCKRLRPIRIWGLVYDDL